MVDEVKIEITADATKAQKALKDTDYWIKALQEDTQLLKDFQVEYKEALAESGGRRTDKVKNAYAKVLRLQSAIAQDKREIEKLDKKEEKHVKGIAKAFKGIGKIVSVGAIFGAVRKSISTAEQGRQESLLAQQLGLSGGQYEAITSGFSALGININEVNQLFSSLRDATLGAKTGLGDFSQVMSALGFFGVSDALNKTPEQILYDLADWASKNNNAQGAFMMRKRLGISQEVFNELAEGRKNVQDLIANAPEKLGSLTTKQLKDQKDTAEAWHEAMTIFKNAVDSWTTGKMGEYLRAIAHWLGVIGRWLGSEEKPETGAKKEVGESTYKKATISHLKTVPVDKRWEYVVQHGMTDDNKVMKSLFFGDKESEEFFRYKNPEMAFDIKKPFWLPNEAAMRSEFMKQYKTQETNITVNVNDVKDVPQAVEGAIEGTQRAEDSIIMDANNNTR